MGQPTRFHRTVRCERATHVGPPRPSRALGLPQALRGNVRKVRPLPQRSGKSAILRCWGSRLQRGVSFLNGPANGRCRGGTANPLRAYGGCGHGTVENRRRAAQDDAAASADSEASVPANAGAGRGDAWDATADAGATVSRGNTDAVDVALVFAAKRSGVRFDHIFDVNTAKSSARDEVTRDQLDIEYDLRRKFGDRWYAVGNFEYFRDAIRTSTAHTARGV